MDKKLVHISTLCCIGKDGCPKIFVNTNTTSDKEVILTDDFGGKVQMSKDQLNEFVRQAQKGEIKL